MIGKKNIVFGLLYLVLTAALGPYMITKLVPGVQEAQDAKRAVAGELQMLAQTDFQREFEEIPAAEIAKLNSRMILAMSRIDNANLPIDQVKGGPHTHGNLESVLNIVAGLVLALMIAPAWIKQIISWIFILGALLHSGMLYLRFLEVGWAGTVLGTGIGPILILVGLFLLGVSAAIWMRPEVVRD